MGGITLARLAGDDVDDAKNRVALRGGLSYVRNWGGVVGLEMDILHSANRQTATSCRMGSMSN